MKKRVALTILSACLQQFRRRRGQECPRYTIIGCKGLTKMSRHQKRRRTLGSPLGVDRTSI